MDYLEYLEHTRTLLQAYHDFEVRTAPPGCVVLPSLLSKIVESEIQNEHKRGELALKLAESGDMASHASNFSDSAPPEVVLNSWKRQIAGMQNDPFRCAQCGEPIMYGERQHVCPGESMRLTAKRLEDMIGEPGCCEQRMEELVAEVRRLRGLIVKAHASTTFNPWGQEELRAEAEEIRCEGKA